MLPFECAGHHEDEYFGDGIAEELIRALAQVSGLRVAAQSSAFYFKGTTDALDHVARRLGVDMLLLGRVLRGNSRVRVTVRLVRPATSETVWSDEIEREFTDVIAVLRGITAAIARSLRLTLHVDETAPAGRPAHPEAYDLYLRGRYIMEMRGDANLRRALQYFERSAAADPDFAPACTGMAQAFQLMAFYGFAEPHDVMPRSRAAAERALALDESMTDAHVALAFALMTYAWDWAGADRHYLRALELNPDDPMALSYYGYYSQLCVHDEVDEAFELMWRAADVDPLSALPLSILGVASYVTGRAEGVLERVRSAVDAQPSFWMLQRVLSLTLAACGRYDEAIVAMERAAQLSNRYHWNLLDLGILRAEMGHDREARALQAELQAIARNGFLQPMILAGIPAALGDTDEAMPALQRAFAGRDSILITLRQFRGFRPIRRDPRFASIVAEMGLAPAA